MPKLDKQTLGRHGENIAAKYFTDNGCELIARNWRCRSGELDLIVHESNPPTTVFVEVKTRQTNRCGSPVEAVTATKVNRLRRLAGLWLAENKPRTENIRLDICAIDVRSDKPAELRHIKAVG